MKITLGKLRRIIREAVTDTAITPYIRNAMSPTSDDREPIERMSLKDMDGEEEIAPHLRNADLPDMVDSNTRLEKLKTRTVSYRHLRLNKHFRDQRQHGLKLFRKFFLNFRLMIHLLSKSTPYGSRLAVS